MTLQNFGKSCFVNGECLEVMADIPDGYFDMILCDLPYGTTACRWDSVIPFESLWEQYRRVIKPNAAIVLTASQPFTTNLINSNFNDFKYCWIWVKSVCGDVFNAKNKPLKKHEDVCVFSNGTTANGSDRRMPYYPQGLQPTKKTVKNKETVRAFFAPRPSHKESYEQTQTGYPNSVLAVDNERGFHPTQKPVPLFEYLIRTYTNEGQRVLDNTAGSGTTAIAAINSNREWVCIEQSEEYFNKAVERVKAHLALR